MAERVSADRTAELLFWYGRKPSRLDEEGRRRDAPRLDAETVLKLALERPVRFADASWTQPGKIDALGQAARAYVRHLFFRPNPTPYQVLGLEPGASAQQIKECFRLLMQLVHPDRQGEKKRWSDSYAAQANWAYSMLRDQETRRTFEEEAEARAALQRAINRAAMAAEASQMPTVIWPKKTAKHKFAIPTQMLPEWLTAGVGGYVRHHPATVAFGGLITIAVIIIGTSLFEGHQGSLIRVARDDRPIPASAAPAPIPASEGAAVATLRSADPGPLRQVHPTSDRPIVLASASAAPISDAARPAPEPSVAALPSAPVAKAPEAPQAAAAPPAALTLQVASTPAGNSASQPASPPEIAPASAAIGAPVPTPPQVIALAAPSAPTVVPPADKEVEALLANFVDSYERGRVDAFAALFDDDADTNLRRGRAAIRNEYDELFRLSQWRRMQLTRMSWRPVGDHAVARGELTVKIGWRDGREVEQRVNVDMELVRRDGRVVIAKLSHQPKNP